jgi:hypothetical protein
VSPAARSTFALSTMGQQYTSLCRLAGFPESESSLYLLTAPVRSDVRYSHKKLQLANERAALVCGVRYVYRVGETSRGHPRMREHLIYRNEATVSHVVPVRGMQTTMAEKTVRAWMRSHSTCSDGEWFGLLDKDADILLDVMSFCAQETREPKKDDEVDEILAFMPQKKKARLVQFAVV